MKKYTILRGWHYAFFLIERLFGWFYNKTEFNIKFKFSPECWWDSPRNSDDYDLNKLCGISFGVFAIHKNSVRLAWVPDFKTQNNIKVYGYVYDGTRNDPHISQYICNVNTDITYDAKIVIQDNKYIISVGDSTIEMKNNTKDHKIQKKGYPYFGGNNRAPVRMSIYECIKSFI
jgi:hypothetical protein